MVRDYILTNYDGKEYVLRVHTGWRKHKMSVEIDKIKPLSLDPRWPIVDIDGDKSGMYSLSRLKPGAKLVCQKPRLDKTLEQQPITLIGIRPRKENWRKRVEAPFDYERKFILKDHNNVEYPVRMRKYKRGEVLFLIYFGPQIGEIMGIHGTPPIPIKGPKDIATHKHIMFRRSFETDRIEGMTVKRFYEVLQYDDELPATWRYKVQFNNAAVMNVIVKRRIWHPHSIYILGKSGTRTEKIEVVEAIFQEGDSEIKLSNASRDWKINKVLFNPHANKSVHWVMGIGDATMPPMKVTGFEKVNRFDRKPKPIVHEVKEIKKVAA